MNDTKGFDNAKGRDGEFGNFCGAERMAIRKMNILLLL